MRKLFSESVTYADMDKTIINAERAQAAAEERERCAQLAASHDVRYVTAVDSQGNPLEWGCFADLLQEAPPADWSARHPRARADM